MGNRDNRSFNNIRHSNCDKRRQKRKQSRLVLLAMATVVLLLVLVLVIFAICSIVDAIRAGSKDPNTDPSHGANAPAGQVIYTQAALPNAQLNRGELVLVNADHSYPDNLTGLTNIYDNRTKVNGSNPYQLNTVFAKQMQPEAFRHMEEMMLKHYELFEDGSVMIKYAYRTYADQDALTSSIAPGYSDHHTGYTVALHQGDVSGNPPLELDHWIYQNCHKYGFIMRYPGDKENVTGVSDYAHCFRYVGVPHANYIVNHGLCLEEYINVLHGYTASNPLTITDSNQKSYLVYYTALADGDITTVSVPSNYAYTVSGDNVSGFIVTIDLSSPIAAE